VRLVVHSVSVASIEPHFFHRYVHQRLVIDSEFFDVLDDLVALRAPELLEFRLDQSRGMLDLLRDMLRNIDVLLLR